MKTSTTEKLNLMKEEIKAKRAVMVRIAGLAEEFTVVDLRQKQLNVELMLDRNNGRLFVDPDDIRAIRLLKAI
jgi:hypothetical protein